MSLPCTYSFRDRLPFPPSKLSGTRGRTDSQVDVCMYLLGPSLLSAVHLGPDVVLEGLAAPGALEVRGGVEGVGVLQALLQLRLEAADQPGG